MYLPQTNQKDRMGENGLKILIWVKNWNKKHLSKVYSRFCFHDLGKGKGLLNSFMILGYHPTWVMYYFYIHIYFWHLYEFLNFVSTLNQFFRNPLSIKRHCIRISNLKKPKIRYSQYENLSIWSNPDESSLIEKNRSIKVP